MTTRATEPLPDALLRLSRGTAVLACTDYAACQVLQACRDADLRVPQQMVVMGIENDSVFCELVRPNLTSIEVETFLIGHKAAEAIDRILRGSRPTRKPSLLLPQHVVERASTDIFATSDALIQNAVRLIRKHAADGLSAKDLVRQLGVSRTRLENCFRRELHRTVSASSRTDKTGQRRSDPGNCFSRARSIRLVNSLPPSCLARR